MNLLVDLFLEVNNRFYLQALLAALNESKGKILDDDSVISTLEKLKNEAAEVGRKAAETDKVMAEVKNIELNFELSEQINGWKYNLSK